MGLGLAEGVGWLASRYLAYGVLSYGALLGVVTEADLLHQNEGLHIPTTFVLLDAVVTLGSSKKLEEEMRRMAAAEVAEIMTPDPVTVGQHPVAMKGFADGPVERLEIPPGHRSLRQKTIFRQPRNLFG